MLHKKHRFAKGFVRSQRETDMFFVTLQNFIFNLTNQSQNEKLISNWDFEYFQYSTIEYNYVDWINECTYVIQKLRSNSSSFRMNSEKKHIRKHAKMLSLKINPCQITIGRLIEISKNKTVKSIQKKAILRNYKESWIPSGGQTRQIWNERGTGKRSEGGESGRRIRTIRRH